MSHGSSYSAANPGVTYTRDGIRVPADDFMAFAGIDLRDSLTLTEFLARTSSPPLSPLDERRALVGPGLKSGGLPDLALLPQETLPKDLKERVQDMADNCADFLNKLFEALGPRVHSRDVATLYDRIKTFTLSEKPFKRQGVPSDANGLASFSGSNRQIHIRPAPWSNSANYQEFRWNAIATTVLNELLHHSRDNGLFSDPALDNAVRSLMSPDKRAVADVEMKQKGYRAGTIGHRAVTGNCKATNPYGPPPKR